MEWFCAQKWIVSNLMNKVCSNNPPHVAQSDVRKVWWNAKNTKSSTAELTQGLDRQLLDIWLDRFATFHWQLHTSDAPGSFQQDLKKTRRGSNLHNSGICFVRNKTTAPSCILTAYCNAYGRYVNHRWSARVASKLSSLHTHYSNVFDMEIISIVGRRTSFDVMSDNNLALRSLWVKATEVSFTVANKYFALYGDFTNNLRFVLLSVCEKSLSNKNSVAVARARLTETVSRYNVWPR